MIGVGCCRIAIAFVCAAAITLANADDNTVRICVFEDARHLCTDMQNSLKQSVQSLQNVNIECVPVKHRFECMEKVRDGLVSFVSVPSTEVYTAGSNFSLAPLAEERLQTSQNEFVYESVAVVRREAGIKSLADLRDKNSCHTGFRRNAGWNFPVAILTDRLQWPDDTVCKGDLDAVASLFKQSCVGGKWSENIQLDEDLKKKHPHLCELCKSGTCSETDTYFGYEGALKCLTEKSADVAFTKSSAAQAYFKANPGLKDNYGYLCLNGTTASIDTPCYWAGRTNSVLMMAKSSTNQQRDSAFAVLQAVVMVSGKPEWFSKIWFTSNDVNDLKRFDGDYLAQVKQANFLTTMTKPQPTRCHDHEPKTIICVSTQPELDKCNYLREGAFIYRLRPKIECTMAGSVDACVESIRKGTADVTVVDSALAPHHMEGGMVPILQEAYNDTQYEYYAVAVTKSNGPIKGLNDLKGKRACFGEMGSAYGWVIPAGILQEKGMLEKNRACELTDLMGDFFGGSCAPGAKGSGRLCENCAGDNQGVQKCAHNSNEQFYGSDGAFRCLVAGKGDVAFIRYSSLVNNTDGRHQPINEAWAKDLKMADYSLLCPDSEVKSSVTTDVGTCHWAAVPGRVVLTARSRSDDEKLTNQALLVAVTSKLGPASKTYTAFGDVNGRIDVLFTGKTDRLKPLPSTTTSIDLLGQQLYTVVDKTYCPKVSSAVRVVGSSVFFGLCVLFISKMAAAF